MYAATFHGTTWAIKVQPCDYANHENNVLQRMKDDVCRTVHVAGWYDYAPGVDASALVLEYVPYEWNEWNEHMLAENCATVRAIQLCQVCGGCVQSWQCHHCEAAHALALLAMCAAMWHVWHVWHVAQGVLEWHKRGYLHRDIKPDNVRVDANGDVIIIDANIAKAIDKCKRGKVMWKRKATGTPAFMDPLVRDGVYDWSPSAEVWSLGLMLESVRRQHTTSAPFPPCCIGCFGSHVSCARACQLLDFTKNPARRENMRRLAHKMMSPDPSKRPCLGMVVGSKCRSENARMCDGTAPAECLYGCGENLDLSK